MSRLRLGRPVEITNEAGAVVYAGTINGLEAYGGVLRITIREADFVDEVTTESTRSNPDFPAMVAGAESERAAAPTEPLSCLILQGHNFLVTGSKSGKGEKVFCSRCAKVEWV